MVLRILLDFSPNASYKEIAFSKTLPEKYIDFIPSREDNIVIFNLSLVPEVDPILEEQGRKKDAMQTRGTGCIKMIFVLFTERIILHI